MFVLNEAESTLVSAEFNDVVAQVTQGPFVGFVCMKFVQEDGCGALKAVLVAISTRVMYRWGRTKIIKKFFKYDYSLPFPVNLACIFLSTNFVKHNFIFNNFANLNSETDNTRTRTQKYFKNCVRAQVCIDTFCR